MTNRPQTITKAEWRDIVKVAEVKEGWGLDGNADEADFHTRVFGVRFDYISDCPGYAGDVFVLLGGEPECPPIVLARDDGKLVAVDSRNY